MALSSSSFSLLRRLLLSSTPLSSSPSPSSILRAAFCSSSASSPTPPPPSSIFGDDTEVSNVPPLTTPNLFVSGLSRLTTDDKLKNAFAHFRQLVEGFEGKLELVVMMRGGGLMGLASQFVGKRGFSTEIFVSRLSFYTTEEELKNIFSPFGAVEEARLVRDNQTGRPKGFGFVKYSSQEEAQKAVKAMDGRILRGRLIFVEIAKERSTG